MILSKLQRKSRPSVEALESRELLSASKPAVLHPAARATPLSISLKLSASTSPAGDYAAVASGRLTLVGQTSPGARVVLGHVAENGRTVALARTRANALGQYRVRIPCPVGSMPLVARATDVSGARASATMTVTRSNQAVVWDSVALQVIRDMKTPPPNCARDLAVVSIAVFDAVNSIDRKYQPYAVSVEVPRTASAEAATASAAYTALLGLFPAEKSMLDAQLAVSLAAIPNGPSKLQGIVAGRSVANQILALRSDDGSSVKGTYNPTPGPGVWVPTPPAYAAPLDPAWGQVTPFAMTSSTQFQAPAPPDIRSEQYAMELMHVEAIGGTTSTIRTADQTEAAHFWADQTGPTFDPPGHWNQIASIAAVSSKSSLATTARMFAMLNIALADAGIAAWGAKYEYNTWRPVTAIQDGDGGLNPLVVANPTWQPLWPTPPFPAYVSGHSTFSSAAAAVLDSIYGTSFAFTDPGDPSQNLKARSFTSFDQAAEEAGMSRIYGGIHFMSDNTAGTALGHQIGTYVVATQLLPQTRPGK